MPPKARVRTLGDRYGSQYHLLHYRQVAPDVLDAAIHGTLENPAPLEWLYPDRSGQPGREPAGLEFLADRPDVQAAWRSFWPTRGTQQHWDGVARRLTPGGPEWLLIEAKANHPEFCTPRCGASPAGGLGKITAALEVTKAHLGVHPRFPWLDTYYQYANRLVTLYFLTVRVRVQTRLVCLYFCGDRFAHDRLVRCPATAADWQQLIEARRLTLGLPVDDGLSRWVHDVFLDVLK